MTTDEALDQTLLKGLLKLQFPTPRDAVSFRMRCYSTRRRERNESRKSFGAPLSRWDNITITVSDSILTLSTSTPVQVIS